MSFSGRERHALCDLLDEVGPEYPTLCAGWATYELVAHLWVREADPLAGPGLVLSAFNETSERRMAAAKRRWSYPELVDKVRKGPPTLSVFTVPVIGPQLNSIEYFVHHEDVRRAGDDITPRDLSQQDQDELWRRFKVASRGLLRTAPTGVTMQTADGRTATMKAAEPMVTVTGEPSELVLLGYGRGRVAKAELTGDETAVAALRQATLGI